MRHPGWIPTAAALVGLLLTLSAAYWQFGRAAYKTELQQAYMARQAMTPLNLNREIEAEKTAMQHRKARVNGIFLPAKAIYLDNRIRAGAAGYEYIVPLRVGGSERTVLVNRGWLAAGPRRDVLPQVPVTEKEVTVEGTIVVPGYGALELSDETVEGVVWQNLDLDRYRKLENLDVLGVVVQEEGNKGDVFNRDWPAPGFGVRTHQSYAMQWLIFAVLIIFFYVYYGFVRNKPASEK